jgi:hypothetical protein
MSHSKDLKKAVELRLKLARQEAEITRLELQLAEVDDKPGKKRKHKSKSKEKEKEKEREDLDSDEAGPIVPPKKRRVVSKWFTTANPEKPNVTIKVGSFNSQTDRANYDRMKKAKEELKKGAPGPAVAVVVKLIKEGLRRKFRWLDYDLVPKEIQDMARAELKEELSDIEFERLVAMDTEESSLTESFGAEFEQHDIHPLLWKAPTEEGVVHGYRGDLEACKGPMARLMDAKLKGIGSFKVFITYKCLMGKKTIRLLEETVHSMDERVVTISSVDTDRSLRPETVRKEEDIEGVINELIERLISFIESRTEFDSGLEWIKSLAMEVYISAITATTCGRWRRATDKAPLVEGPVGSWTPLPKWLCNRHIMNPKPHRAAEDNKCFAWCILRGIYPWPNYGSNRGTNIRDIEHKLPEIILPEGVTYPIELNDISLLKIQELNDFSFSIFKLGKKSGHVKPMYVSPLRLRKTYHFLLGVIDGDRGHHFVLIGEDKEQPLSKLFRKDGKNGKKHICEGCLRQFRKGQAKEDHMMECLATARAQLGMMDKKKEERRRIRVPKSVRHKYIKFSKWETRLKAPFVVYADIEALLATMGQDEDAFQVHKPVCWVYKIVCEYGKHAMQIGAEGKPLGETRSYCGKGAMHSFLKSLGKDLDTIERIIHEPPADMLPLKDEEILAHNQATDCFICGKPFSGSLTSSGREQTRVRDHDHFSGNYRGAAHNSCNLRYTTHKGSKDGEEGFSYRLPVVIHNLKGYDGFHVLRGLKGFKELYEANIEVIAQTLDRFTSFSIDKLRFIDSMAFLKSSLDSMVSERKGGTLEQKKAKFPRTHKEFVNGMDGMNEEEYFDLFLKKGIYPYEYMRDKWTLDEEELPSRDKFWSVLNDRGISEEDYEHAQTCWTAMGCKNLRDYTLGYCKLDVMLLADIFEGLRDKCLDFRTGYGLDPIHFITAPSLSWAAMLLFNHKNDIVIENMTDIDMLVMVKGAIRGGMCQVGVA